ncbi:S8 family serine peptidase [Roseobacter sp. HKCCD9010]|uniref:S8 family serine peptidase n=1 Tax=unclassified Roseobacter TaxID=196798 RepID=UPI001491382E|nr:MULTISPECIES: S8 family serine peptidase [unclassified Roseobacter]MBF9049726.1 S8 family serine peptidase [Rhodobacterales bacterium HKCCD4356]NNV11726.1 S8 family serine peptidase [Roseobacter sp. HKCCD7357]NNV15910.1 S8 family serine peptidase [Roseobacter sp. HKCCD8768]NNV25370.1 S8 family serine peptidase [Roseobacter sp. HKCCD8192]NNV33900.1 S8 family serine peptidase [Roseobacter sp. HKCCD9073]
MQRLAALLIFVTAFAVAGPMASAQTTGGQGGQGVVTDRGDDGEGTRGGASRDAVRIAGGRIEYVVIGPPGQSNAAAQALSDLGADLRRTRDYPTLNRRALFFAFPQGLTSTLAQVRLDAAAPQSFVDIHAIYRFAQGSPRLYAPEMVGMAAPQRCQLSGSVTLGLIDGPVDPSHPALARVRVTNESVLNRDDRPPGADHGTAVAILMAGRDEAGALAGFAGGARLHAISAFTQSRGREAGDIERIAAALDRLLSQGVRLINMSFAGPENRAMADVLDAAAGRGAVMIAAAGNNGQALAAYPAGYSDVIAVTAVDAGYRRYRRANFGEHIEFAAPGVDLFVATRRGAHYASGTSYAAPIITALAARLAPGGSVQTVRNRLRAASVDLGSPGRDAEFGWGLVRAGGC